MAKSNTSYTCSECGYSTPKWFGQCPQCKEWNTLEEKVVIKNARGPVSSTSSVACRMKDVHQNVNERIITGISEFDRVVGNGLVRDSVSILSAVPGAGKSTLSIMIANKMTELGYNVLYASGEESCSQIKSRANRLKLRHSDDIWIIDNGNLDRTIEEIKEKDIDFVIIDSIQTFFLNEFLPSRPGNPTQVIECASAIRDICKNPDRPRAAMIIGQMTKDDELAGSRSLEHLVDTYIRIENEKDDNLRILYAVKNRFGNTGETGFFRMTETGLECIENPSEYFITEHEVPPIGVALSTMIEGSRIIICEIEALISKTLYSNPLRIADSMKRDQLTILTSILEQHGDINLIDKNVIVKTSGGIKLNDIANNLSIIMAIASSHYHKDIPSDVLFIGDVGLTGEIKKIMNLENRIKEAERMGYKKVYIAKNSIKNITFKNIEVIEKNTLKDVLNDVFKS